MVSDLEMLKEAGEALEWINENGKELSEKYAGKMIAVKGRELIATAGTLDELFEEIRKKGLRQQEMIIEWIPNNKERIIYTPFALK
mgnify:CR=1 FL=1